MKPLGVTATLQIGNHKPKKMEWEMALSNVKIVLALRQMNAPEYTVAMVAIGLYSLCTGKVSR